MVAYHQQYFIAGTNMDRCNILGADSGDLDGHYIDLAFVQQPDDALQLLAE